MRNALIVVGLGLMAWFAYTRTIGQSPAPVDSRRDDGLNLLATEAEPQFNCDGRTHCSQMTSCEEAEFFLRNCPGVKMDGNNDGEPCESQWCGNAR